MFLIVRVRALALAAALSAGAAGVLAAQGLSDEGAYVVRLGRDTIAVERFRLTPGALEGELLVHTPSTVLRRYKFTLGPDGTVSRAEWSMHAADAPAGAAPRSTGTASFGADTVTVETRQGDSTRTRKVALKSGALPLFFPGFAPYQILTARVRGSGGDSLATVTYFVGSAQPMAATVKRVGSDTVTVRNDIGLFEMRVDNAGRVLGVKAPQSTVKVVVERVPSVDIAAVGTRWAATDAQGRSMGQLSPRDTVTATLGGANVSIDYSRPMKRGRVIFGNVVPWGQVWRTGANAATQLMTDKEIVIGGATVPAGTYTLWTLPTQQGWKLIINKQTGQWGTEYHPEQDLARVDLKTERVATPVEQFTISLDPSAPGGVMNLVWDGTKASVGVAGAR